MIHFYLHQGVIFCDYDLMKVADCFLLKARPLFKSVFSHSYVDPDKLFYFLRILYCCQTECSIWSIFCWIGVAGLERSILVTAWCAHRRWRTGMCQWWDHEHNILCLMPVALAPQRNPPTSYTKLRQSCLGGLWADTPGFRCPVCFMDSMGAS